MSPTLEIIIKERSQSTLTKKGGGQSYLINGYLKRWKHHVIKNKFTGGGVKFSQMLVDIKYERSLHLDRFVCLRTRRCACFLIVKHGERDQMTIHIIS